MISNDYTWPSGAKCLTLDIDADSLIHIEVRTEAGSESPARRAPGQ